MDKDNQNLNKENKAPAGVVHVLLSHSYIIFFFAVVFGIVCDALFPVRVFNGVVYEYIGLFMIIVGSYLVYWAQSSTSTKNFTDKRDINFFLKGPYKYTRNPTNFGLTLTVLGLGLLINSLFVVIFLLIVYVISKLIFIKQQDTILEEKYGEVFREYKRVVKDWL